MKDLALPLEFTALQGKIDYVQRVSSNEYSSSCPQCGGVPHRGGERPDRFRLFLNAKGRNKVMGWCRRCNYVWFPDASRALSPEEMESWRREQIQREEERKRSAETALKNLRSEKVWLKYHEMLGELGRKTIREWGIRQDWADYWRLGMFPDYKVYGKDGEYFSPAVTIPMWQQDSPVPGNIKLRVLNPKNSHDRYRNLYKTGMTVPFVAFNKLHADKVVLVEGEKKAMVVAQWSGQKYQVVGLPSVTPDDRLLAEFAKYGTIVVCLDPDAKVAVSGESPLKRLVRSLGREVQVVDLPDKVDDMINRGMKFDSAMKYSKVMEVK